MAVETAIMIDRIRSVDEFSSQTFDKLTIVKNEQGPSEIDAIFASSKNMTSLSPESDVVDIDITSGKAIPVYSAHDSYLDLSYLTST